MFRYARIKLVKNILPRSSLPKEAGDLSMLGLIARDRNLAIPTEKRVSTHVDINKHAAAYSHRWYRPKAKQQVEESDLALKLYLRTWPLNAQPSDFC
jgi:hypothetical protein